jgi:hypothetical protein
MDFIIGCSSFFGSSSFCAICGGLTTDFGRGVGRGVARKILTFLFFKYSFIKYAPNEAPITRVHAMFSTLLMNLLIRVTFFLCTN